MSKTDVLAEALRIGEAVEAQARGRPMNDVPRGAGVGTNLDPAPKFSLRQANKLAKELGIPEPAHLGSNLYGTVTVVTPRMAYNWLERRDDKTNRLPTESQLATLAREASKGRFLLMDQGISFNQEGGLENGQHRCWAILVSRRPVRAMVILNLPPGARKVTDQTVRRDAKHLIDIFGHDKIVTNNQLAVIRRAMFGMGQSQRVSIEETFGFAAEHKRPFRWLFRHFDQYTRGVTVAAVQACVFRARVSLPSERERLEQFAYYLAAARFLHGRYTEHRDHAVQVLRDWLVGGTPRRRKASATEIYATTAYMLQAFLDCEDSRIGRVREDPFPKPVPILDREEPFNVSELVEAAKEELGIAAEADDE